MSGSNGAARLTGLVPKLLSLRNRYDELSSQAKSEGDYVEAIESAKQILALEPPQEPLN